MTIWQAFSHWSRFALFIVVVELGFDQCCKGILHDLSLFGSPVPVESTCEWLHVIRIC